MTLLHCFTAYASFLFENTLLCACAHIFAIADIRSEQWAQLAWDCASGKQNTEIRRSSRIKRAEALGKDKKRKAGQ